MVSDGNEMGDGKCLQVLEAEILSDGGDVADGR